MRLSSSAHKPSNKNFPFSSDIENLSEELYNTLFPKTWGLLIALTTTSDNGLLVSLSTILPEIDLSQGIWDCISSDKNRNKYIIHLCKFVSYDRKLTA